MSYIFVRDISKTFEVAVKNKSSKKQSYKAVKNVSFDVAKGQIVGIVGPKNSGKTTIVKILAGVLNPSSGICRINGYSPVKDRLRYVKNVSVMFGSKSKLYGNISIKDNLRLLKEIYEIGKKEFVTNKGELIKFLKLGSILNVPVKRLDFNKKIKCELAASLITSPRVLILDDLISKLDNNTKRVVISLIRKLNQKRELTVILTSRKISDLIFITKNIIMINKGTIIFDNISKEKIRLKA